MLPPLCVSAMRNFELALHYELMPTAGDRSCEADKLRKRRINSLRENRLGHRSSGLVRQADRPRRGSDRYREF